MSAIPPYQSAADLLRIPTLPPAPARTGEPDLQFQAPLRSETPQNSLSSGMMTPYAVYPPQGLQKTPVSEYVTDEKHMEQIYDKMTFLLLVMLAMPAVECVRLASDMECEYWLGNWGIMVVVISAIWIAAGHQLLILDVLHARIAVMIVFVVPTILYMLAMNYHMMRSLDVYSQVSGLDCATHPEKFKLDLAWREANQLYLDCVRERANVTNLPVDEVRKAVTVRSCQGFERGMEQWGREWKYLEALETKGLCGGWCEVHAPIFRPHLSEGWVVDRCSLAAADTMGNSVFRSARQNVVHCALVTIVLGVVLSTMDL